MKNVCVILISALLMACGGGGGSSSVRAIELPTEDMMDMMDMPIVEMPSLMVGRHYIEYPDVFRIEFLVDNDATYPEEIIFSSIIRTMGQNSGSIPDISDGPLVWNGAIIGARTEWLDFHEHRFQADMTVTIGRDTETGDLTVFFLATNPSQPWTYGEETYWTLDWDVKLGSDGTFFEREGDDSTAEKAKANNEINGSFVGANHEGVTGVIRDWDRGIDQAIFGAIRDE